MLALSDFQPTAHFGGLVALTVALALAVELVVLPPALAWLAPTLSRGRACESWNRSDSLARSVSCGIRTRSRGGSGFEFSNACRGAERVAPLRSVARGLAPHPLQQGGSRDADRLDGAEAHGTRRHEAATRALGARARSRTAPQAAASAARRVRARTALPREVRQGQRASRRPRDARGSRPLSDHREGRHPRQLPARLRRHRHRSLALPHPADFGLVGSVHGDRARRAERRHAHAVHAARVRHAGLHVLAPHGVPVPVRAAAAQGQRGPVPESLVLDQAPAARRSSRDCAPGGRTCSPPRRATCSSCATA